MRIASAPLITSPLPMTGILTARFTRAMADQSAFVTVSDVGEIIGNHVKKTPAEPAHPPEEEGTAELSGSDENRERT